MENPGPPDEKANSVNIPDEFRRPTIEDFVPAEDEAPGGEDEADVYDDEGLDNDAALDDDGDDPSADDDDGDAADAGQQVEDPRESRIQKSMEELTRRERKIHQQAQDLKQFVDQLGGFDNVKKLAEAMAKKDEDPVAAMDAMGIPYEDAAPLIMNNMSPTPEMLHKQTSKHVESLQNELKMLQQQRKEEEEQRQYERYKSDVFGSWGDDEKAIVEAFSSSVGSSPEKLMLGLFEKYYSEEQKILTADEMSATLLTEAKDRIKALASSGILEKLSEAKEERKSKGSKKHRTQQAGNPQPPTTAGGKRIEDMTREEYTEYVIAEMTKSE